MINQAEVETIVQQHSGTRMFEELLCSSDSPMKILRLLALYAEFNFDAGPCIAALTAQITSQRSLFVDRSATLFQDRSYEVASCIFDAAVDEFVGRSKKHAMTHRDMVQRMVIVAARYFSVDPAVLHPIPASQPRHLRFAIRNTLPTTHICQGAKRSRTGDQARWTSTPFSTVFSPSATFPSSAA